MTTDNLIDLQIAGLKCDNEECNYEDNSVKLEEYESYLNKPCPQCGENLLTDADMQTVTTMIEMTEALNGMKDLFPQEMLDEGEVARVRLNMKGDGSLTVTEVDSD